MEIKHQIIDEIIKELDKAEAKHPSWPTDVMHQIAIVNEESGEATRAALHLVYENGTVDELEKELIQTGAMCLRMLVRMREGRSNYDVNGLTKHDVTRFVCQLCKDTGWYFVPNFGGGGTTHRCLCGK